MNELVPVLLQIISKCNQALDTLNKVNKHDADLDSIIAELIQERNGFIDVLSEIIP